jgi:spore germination protein
MDIYVVQPGDTIASIADKYGVTVERLIQSNELHNPNDLVPGQTIVIAYPKQVHTVQEGDTLLSIAGQYGVTVNQLLRNNPYLAGREFIYPDETIVISYNTKGNMVTHGFGYPFISPEIYKKTFPNLTYFSIFNYRATQEGEIFTYYDDTELIKAVRCDQSN